VRDGIALPSVRSSRADSLNRGVPRHFSANLWNQIWSLAFMPHCTKTGWVMPSSEYYRRQADTLLTLALTTTDPELSNWYRCLAMEYKMLAAKAADDCVSPRAGIDNLSGAADQREAD
jgi:hypothetical protein